MFPYDFALILYNIEHNSQWCTVIRWVGVLFIVTPSILISCFPETAKLTILFISYGIGACLWMLVGWHVKDTALICLNFFYAMVDAYGIYIRL